MRKKIWIPIALAGVLGYTLVSDSPESQTCYSSVDVAASFDRSGNISVAVSSGGDTICTGLVEGSVCRIQVEDGSTLAAQFDSNNGQFVYVGAAGPNRANVLTSAQTIASQLDFAVVGVNGTQIAVEGDPKIQLVPTSCN